MIFFRCWFGSRLTFILVVSGLLALGFFVGIANGVLENWAMLGWNKVQPWEETWYNVSVVYYVCCGFGSWCYYQAHWMFSWRYFKVSQLLSSMINQNCGNSKIVLNSIDAVMSILIAANFAAFIYIAAGDPNIDWSHDPGYNTTWTLLPLVFTAIDSVVLLVAVFRVWFLLRNEPDVSMNEGFMAAHGCLLFFLLGFQGMAFYLSSVRKVSWYYLLWTSYHISNFILQVVMCYIMW